MVDPAFAVTATITAVAQSSLLTDVEIPALAGVQTSPARLRASATCEDAGIEYAVLPVEGGVPCSPTCLTFPVRGDDNAGHHALLTAPACPRPLGRLLRDILG